MTEDPAHGGCPVSGVRGVRGVRATDGGRIDARSTASRAVAYETCTCRGSGVATKRLLGVLMARYTMRQQLVSFGEDRHHPQGAVRAVSGQLLDRRGG